jgi:hypothetical protein
MSSIGETNFRYSKKPHALSPSTSVLFVSFGGSQRATTVAYLKEVAKGKGLDVRLYVGHRRVLHLEDVLISIGQVGSPHEDRCQDVRAVFRVLSSDPQYCCDQLGLNPGARRGKILLFVVPDDRLELLHLQSGRQRPEGRIA